MSGHSKWSKVKHQKASTDAAKGKLFTKLTMSIIIAAREGGSADPDANFKLRLVVDKAKSMNMPKENIERALVKAKGNAEGVNLEQIVYEAFGPKGVGIIIETATDNKQRTVSEIKNILDRGGGVLASRGAVAPLFSFVGLLVVNKKDKSFDDIMSIVIDAGAIDMEESGDAADIYTQPVDLHKVKEAISKAGLEISTAELYYRPLTQITIDNKADSQKILKLMANLEQIDDVQKLSSNFDIPEEYLE